MGSTAMILGVDTGGTFTDFVLWDGIQLRVHKVLSTPHAPEEAILQGVCDLGITLDGLTVVHGSTVATNAVLEGKGAKTVFITNQGFRDLLTIGRQARAELYNLQPESVEPPVPEAQCLETGGRISASGETIDPLTTEDLVQLREAVAQQKPEAVAINLLFSFLDDSFERAIEQALVEIPENLFISRSSAVLPEVGEYERGMATWLNSYVGPKVEGYLQRLQTGLAQANVSVMQSSGSTISAKHAGRGAVHLLLSGPAGGLAAAESLGKTIGREQLLTFDMGGTSTDVALIDGGIQLTSEGKIDRYPVAVPMVDMHTIGAGGGSIAAVDAGGLLQVGPESAGAAPGPACYGKGGTQATVTDANLVLGRLLPDSFLGGDMRLDVDAAKQAVSKVAEKLHCSLEEAAEGIIRIANDHMSRALQFISMQRGIDPRPFTLVSFGGAGGLHVCALADALGMKRAVVPAYGGVLSALGMLVAPRGREFSQAIVQRLDQADFAELKTKFQQLEQQGRDALIAEGVQSDAIQTRRSVDLRYQGQSHPLNLVWKNSVWELEEDFHKFHQQRYGHNFDFPVELVNVRIAVREQKDQSNQFFTSEKRNNVQQKEPIKTQQVYGIGDVPVYPREMLEVGMIFQKPMLITEQVATTWVEPGWQVEIDLSGSLLLEKLDNNEQ